VIRQCTDARDDLLFLAPWLDMPSAPSALRRFRRSAVPTLRELPLCRRAHQALERRAIGTIAPQDRRWLASFGQHVEESGRNAAARAAAIENGTARAGNSRRWTSIFSRPERRLFAIGFITDRARRETLRPARVGRGSGVRRHRHGTGAAGKLVHARPPVDRDRR
jgi:hypothetical protein